MEGRRGSGQTSTQSAMDIAMKACGQSQIAYGARRSLTYLARSKIRHGNLPVLLTTNMARDPSVA